MGMVLFPILSILCDLVYKTMFAHSKTVFVFWTPLKLVSRLAVLISSYFICCHTQLRLPFLIEDPVTAYGLWDRHRYNNAFTCWQHIFHIIPQCANIAVSFCYSHVWKKRTQQGTTNGHKVRHFTCIMNVRTSISFGAISCTDSHAQINTG